MHSGHASAVAPAMKPYWGNPGGLPRMLMAGLIGWRLAVSVVQTSGLGWALHIHTTLDISIVTILLGRTTQHEAPADLPD